MFFSHLFFLWIRGMTGGIVLKYFAEEKDRSVKRTGTSVEAVLFDLDGTLIDSVPVYFRMMETILKTIGLPPAPKSVVAEFMVGGMSVMEKLIPPEMKHRKDEIVREFVITGKKIARNIFHDEVDVFHGVPELFALLMDLEIPIGIVTSTETENIERKLVPLDRRGIKGCLSAIVGIEDAARKKPAPDPLIECSRRLGVDPEKCIYVGDSHVDIVAGNAAGMTTIGVLTGLDNRKRLKEENPDLILDSVNDLNRLFFDVG
jgi:phosphoglycolate phosphatase-like HAD superfamily hydrolase